MILTLPVSHLINSENYQNVPGVRALEFKKQHQGMDNLRKYFEENKEIGKYLFHKFREVLKKT